MTNNIYANVAVEIQARELNDRLFTYRVPADLVSETFIGAQVLVPFGPQSLGGYVVSLSDKSATDVPIKEIAEVVDSEPLFDHDYVNFLYWLADYYGAGLSDVIAAAIPSDFSGRLKRIVTLAEDYPVNGNVEAMAIVNVLAQSKTKSLSINALRQRAKKTGKLTQQKFYRALNYLRHNGGVVIKQETTESLSPKLITNVILNGIPGKTSRQKDILALLESHGGAMTMKSLLEEGKTTHATVKRLATEGFITLTQEEVLRDPFSHITAERALAKTTSTLPQLTNDQRSILTTLSHALKSTISQTDSPSSASVIPWLVHGVTGSGKTEIYLRLIDETIKAGRSALLLVPEISLTPQLSRRLIDRFGADVAIWHSALSPGERYDTWRRLRMGNVRVLLGARSAVLTHIPNLGLIVIDEEHDSSYKQTSPSPRYNAKDVALEKARRQQAMVVLGSATPDLGSFIRAKNEGQLLELPKRVFDQPLPKVQLVDMREEFTNGNRGIFSHTLQNSIANSLSNHEQIILLINRRGYASHVFCRACGYVVKCRQCSVPMVFHQPYIAQSDSTGGQTSAESYRHGHLACHHCGFRSGAVETCPSCKSPFIRPFGLGTQRVEQDVAKLFPEARILRLDSDVASHKGAHDRVLNSFAQGEADILIGTQMVAKGLDIEKVTLVGVLAADAAFNLPDYRSTERGFQLLTQIAGRTGRGSMPGIVIMQTYNLELPGLTWACTHDYATFAKEELASRELFEYPPFSQLIRIVVSGVDELSVQATCEKTAEEISNLLDDTSSTAVKILGPAPCLIEKLRGKFRYHLLVKNMSGEKARQSITEFYRNKRLPQGIIMAIDIDALDLL